MWDESYVGMSNLMMMMIALNFLVKQREKEEEVESGRK